jgi:hypothetical protein
MSEEVQLSVETTVDDQPAAGVTAVDPELVTTIEVVEPPVVKIAKTVFLYGWYPPPLSFQRVST